VSRFVASRARAQTAQEIADCRDPVLWPDHAADRRLFQCCR